MILQVRKPVVGFVEIFWMLIASIAVSGNPCFASVKIAVIGKTKNDSFYEQSFRGCEHFAKEYPTLECIYDGADDYQDVRTQVLIVEELVKKGIDGLLISTTDSKFLVNGALKQAQQAGIPVITFDSDLLPEHHAYRLAYVGTNNYDFGKALGRVAKKYRNQSGVQKYCIQSGHHTTPNLSARIQGVKAEFKNEARREGETGTKWMEHERCPLYTMGRREDALNQLLAMLKSPTPPVFIAVAGFAQFNPNYIARLTPHKEQIQNHQAIIISADTEQIQLAALKAGLATENVGQNPFQMGFRGAQLLYDAIMNKTQPKQTRYFLDFHYCQSHNTDTCTINH
ncbi:ribose transport system substrate-binding protein [Pseudoalteromonas citrea]|uniref:Ribose transport system substrate-binding protein n=2 Tax=Pseudoalteromonas citrea TaxID=43655 RepID=A0AAD4FTJ4_9GAMM|nr:substrate-binding domain-containing protein [Pseudoalteromonas citrea]KAF7774520.1 ribose transport system substrate-binding protein [Pseudoalteromonas citrea]